MTLVAHQVEVQPARLMHRRFEGILLVRVQVVLDACMHPRQSFQCLWDSLLSTGVQRRAAWRHWARAGAVGRIQNGLQMNIPLGAPCLVSAERRLAEHVRPTLDCLHVCLLPGAFTSPDAFFHPVDQCKDAVRSLGFSINKNASVALARSLPPRPWTHSPRLSPHLPPALHVARTMPFVACPSHSPRSTGLLRKMLSKASRSLLMRVCCSQNGFNAMST